MPRKAKSTPAAAPAVASIRHKDTRPNIPTEELRDFVAVEESAPPVLRYPRDPSLDPQLVWKGKDEQDGKDLEVPAVPIYIQEKIHPQAIIDDLLRQARDRAKAADKQADLDLFADFNGLPKDFDQRVDFYRHTAHWANRLILGDSLLVMSSLAEKEGFRGKVQTIFFDPPYGIKFNSNWQVSTRKREVKDGKAEDATRQPEQIRAFRDTWKLGIHSYLAYLRDRLIAARDLLTESGSVFVQIGDENVHLARNLLDEVFGSENFCGQIVFATTTGRGSTLLGQISDYIVWYAKKKEHVKYRQLYSDKEIGEAGATRYDYVELPDGTRRRMAKSEKEDLQSLGDKARFFSTDQITSAGESTAGSIGIKFQGKLFPCPSGLHWKTTLAGMERLIVANRVVAEGNLLRYVRFLDDFSATPLNSIWPDIGGVQSRSDPKVYVVQTSTTAIQRCILMTTDPGDLVLDPTCGSGTTAYAAEQWGRRWITIDTSRVALALARTRLMAAKFPYYLLADSPEGIAKEGELTGRMPPPHPTENDIRQGFVCRRLPHVTLKSIANNPEIKEGMSREEIDAVIARRADTEILCDQPYDDGKRVRVCGPFTVESLSPHRVLPPADENLDGVVSTREAQRQQDFTGIILDNLLKAGVQNTVKNERLKFDRLDPFPGQWLQAAGEYTDAQGKVKRVAVSIGPEHGTVGPVQVKEAAKEAVKGVGFDVLIVCGFAFDPHVTEEAKRYGKLVVLPARMNPDLAMGDELLKKTGAGNLFTVFGEPDIEVRKTKDKQIEVEIKGVDVYDPTTGQVRSSTTDDLACWFVDTDYNGESFFVRQAYFLGADEPYEKLQRALRAQVDEAAWSTLYRTVSRPFPKPSTGKIAVKAINHYGDEVLRVMEV